jgi:hypothetical protein
MHMQRASHGSARPLNCGVMRHSWHPARFKISRSVVMTGFVLLLVAGASLFSMPLFMANTDDSRIGWVATMWVLFFVCGLAVGACLHRWWFVAVAIAWLPLLLLPEYMSYIERSGVTTELLMFVLSPGGAAAWRVLSIAAFTKVVERRFA